MRLPILILVAVAGATTTGCASKRSTVPGDTPRLEREIPRECRIKCGNPPGLHLAPEQHQLEMSDWGLSCARLHSDCVEALNHE